MERFFVINFGEQNQRIRFLVKVPKNKIPFAFYLYFFARKTHFSKIIRSGQNSFSYQKKNFFWEYFLGEYFFLSEEAASLDYSGEFNTVKEFPNR